MAERTEEELARALKAAAGLAPEPAFDLTQGIAARRRRRRRRRLQTALAVTGVVAVIGTGMTVMRGTFPGHRDGVLVEPAASASMPPALPASPPSFPPATQVWPEAVFRIPARAKDGAEYRPVTALSAREVLLSAESPEREGRLEVYDMATKTISVLAPVPHPARFRRYTVQGWDVDSRHIVWYATAQTAEGVPVAEFWALPRKGGAPRLIWVLQGDDVEKVEKVNVAGDDLAWSLTTGGVFTVSLRGDEKPVRVPNSERLFLQQWPWAGDRPGRYVDDPARNQSIVVNLETGESRPVKAGDAQGLRCGPEWCVGERRDDRQLMSAVVQRVDGTQRREVRQLRSFPTHDGVVDDRFAVLTVSGVVGWDITGEEVEPASVPIAVVYDRVTGARVAVGARTKDGGGSFGRGTASAPSDIVYWNAGRTGGREEYWVLNLAAVR